MSTASEKANLARIRDNQRRSRARRKEYLQELEARLRQCELQGIEASSEIQMAARRVADENKKLRVLLVQHGVGEDIIENFLQTSPTSESSMMGGYGSNSGAVQILEQLLQTRKSCCADGSNPTNGGGPGSRGSSVSVGTVQSLWDPIYSQNTGGRRRSGTLQPTGGKAASSAHQFMSPTASTASHASNGSMGHSSNRSIAHHQRLAPVQLSRHSSPATNGNLPRQMFDFDTQILSNSSPYSHQNTAQKHLQPSSAPQNRSSVYIPTTSSVNVNNCNYAVDMITSMAGVDPNTVKADLGCIPGMDCDVDNHLVFNVMDRYTGGGVGL